VTTADVATAIEETVGLRPGSVSAAEARGIVDFEVSSLEKKGDGVVMRDVDVVFFASCIILPLLHKKSPDEG